MGRTIPSFRIAASIGRKRIRVLKELGWKQIPVNVIREDATEMDIKMIAVNENLQQMKLKDVERGFGILSVYQEGGYTERQAIQGTKFLDNYFDRNPEAKAYDERNFVPLIKKTLHARHTNAKNNFVPDEKFLGICRKLALTPKYQYQLLQIVVDLDPDVLVETQ